MLRILFLVLYCSYRVQQRKHMSFFSLGPTGVAKPLFSSLIIATDHRSPE